MTEEQTELRPWVKLAEMAEQDDGEALDAFLDEMSVGDTARAISRLEPEGQEKVITTLPPQDAADLIEELPDRQAADLLTKIPPHDAASILEELPSNQLADLIGLLDADRAEQILTELNPETASKFQRLAHYPPDVAGGLMITEYLSYNETTRVQDVVNDMRAHAEAYSDYDVQYTYVVSEKGALKGVLRLRDLILAPGGTTLSNMMILDPIHVQDTAPLDELAEFFDRHQFIGVPVVDKTRTLLGVVRRYDVEEALADRSGNDYLKSQGIVGGEEFRTMPVWRRASRRLSWLSINILLNIVAASVIAAYQDTLSAVIALAVFLPIISDMSGCSGTQAVAVSMRELSLGLVRPFEALRVWGKELTVGSINGVALGLLLGGVGWLWKGNLYLGLVVGVAMALNTVVSVSIGGTVPLILKRFKVDPALASGPILTTITDMFGFFLVLSFATLMLAKLA
ncbi:MAG: magnesium transporter [Deltaproteobacteria bacterium]|nr:magnesium transporter [Deltaproteobacteria bacterium]